MLDKKYRWKWPVPNTGTDNDLKYRSHRALTWSYLPLPNGKVCKVGQTVAQWWRSCWWKKPGVQAACTDRSRVPDTRRVPVRSRGVKDVCTDRSRGLLSEVFKTPTALCVCWPLVKHYCQQNMLLTTNYNVE